MPTRQDALIFGLIALALVLTHLAAYLFGWRAHADDEAKRAATARDALVALEIKYRKQGEQHALTVDHLNANLNAAHRQLAELTTGRRCLSAAAVRVLNRTGRVPAAAAGTAGAPEAAEEPADDGFGEPFATDLDAATALAECRTQYGVVTDQLNRIIDIELERTKSQ